MIINQMEHVGKIDDEIIAQIRSSAFLVADFTGHRGGVYFEAGYAMGRDLPVPVWTCRKDEMAQLHFEYASTIVLTGHMPPTCGKGCRIELKPSQ